MKKIIFTAFSAGVLLSGCTAQSNMNPFVGVWTSDFGGCTETYEFKPDGTRTYTSNEEKGVAKYGFTKLSVNTYKMTDIITQTNGGADCAGKTGSEVGHKVTIYIKMNVAKNELTMCGDPNFTNCIQPFIKK